jgi:membrane protein YdbS with pleckstrin-like domain
MSNEAAEPVVWSSYPSWRQFSWLYLMSAVVALRAVLFRRFEVPGWEAWLVGALLLIAMAAVLRRWAHYEVTASRVLVRNGFTRRVIAQCALSQAEQVELRQGPIAALLGIGTVVIQSQGKPAVTIRGVQEPELIKHRIERAIAASGRGQVALGF